MVLQVVSHIVYSPVEAEPGRLGCLVLCELGGADGTVLLWLLGLLTFAKKVVLCLAYLPRHRYQLSIFILITIIVFFVLRERTLTAKTVFLP